MRMYVYTQVCTQVCMDVCVHVCNECMYICTYPAAHHSAFFADGRGRRNGLQIPEPSHFNFHYPKGLSIQ